MTEPPAYFQMLSNTCRPVAWFLWRNGYIKKPRNLERDFFVPPRLMTLFYKFAAYFKSHSRPISCLSELDSLYMHAISDLGIEVRTAYCQRLIERTKYGLENLKDKEKREKREQLLRAAEREICNLSMPKSK